MPCTACITSNNGKNTCCNTNGLCMINGTVKQTSYDWLWDIQVPEGQYRSDFLEVMFKNGRKEYFRNSNNIQLSYGDIVAVESSPGHDIGTVTLTGETARLQMLKKNIPLNSSDIRHIYRKVHDGDIKKWNQAREREIPSLFRAREIAAELSLNMKLDDVEYQGDNNKATFYFSADGRVDFRELIRILAAEFKVRIEMRQIGLRQEAGRLGSIADCGRELCCSTWLSDYKAVSTNTARHQHLAINADKLTGQCGKLKCCINYELDVYMDALKEFPDTGIVLQAEKGDAVHQKTEIFRKMIWYAYKNSPDSPIQLPLSRVKEIIELNRKGIKPTDLKNNLPAADTPQPVRKDTLLNESITRFDKKIKEKKNKDHINKFRNQHKKRHR